MPASRKTERVRRVRSAVSEHDDVEVVEGTTLGPEIDVDHLDVANHRRKATRDAVTDDAATDDTDAGHQRSGSSSGRQPPCWGGVPPVPLTRSTAAARPIMKMAENARRRNFIGTRRLLGGRPLFLRPGTEPGWWG